MTSTNEDDNWFAAGRVDWDLYAQCRPAYPKALFTDILKPYIEARNPAFSRGNLQAIDYGTGNGVIVEDLITHCRIGRVLGTDLNDFQLQQAVQRLEEKGYDSNAFQVRAGGAGTFTDLSDGSFDLVTAAEAVHWFDQRLWLAECSRILRPGGTVAFWFYHFWCQILGHPAAVKPLAKLWESSITFSKTAAFRSKIRESTIKTCVSILGSVPLSDDHFEHASFSQKLLPKSVWDELPNGKGPEWLNARKDYTAEELYLRQPEVQYAQTDAGTFLRRTGWKIDDLKNYVRTLGLPALDEWLASDEIEGYLKEVEEAVGGPEATFDVGWNLGIVMATKRGLK